MEMEYEKRELALRKLLRYAREGSWSQFFICKTEWDGF